MKFKVTEIGADGIEFREIGVGNDYQRAIAITEEWRADLAAMGLELHEGHRIIIREVEKL